MKAVGQFKYDILQVARKYVKSLFEFIIKKTNIMDCDEAMSLLLYCVKKIYLLDPIELSESTFTYGNECISYLNRLEEVPKNPVRVNYEDRVKLVYLCELYAEVSGIFASDTIEEGRCIYFA